MRKGLTLAVLVISTITTALSPAQATWPGQNGRIVFVSDRRGGNDDMYTMNAQGKRVRRVKATVKPDSSPSWSPNGRKIAYTCTGVEICKINPDGTKQKFLTDTPGDDADPAWSPSGKKIVFHSDRLNDGDYEIFKMNADGSNENPLFDTPNFEFNPVWFLTPNLILFNGDVGVYSVNPDGSDIQPFINNASSAQYSPNGNWVVFIRTHKGDADIFRIRADGSGIKRLTTNNVNDYGPVWSPDGQRILFTRILVDGELFTMNRDGSGVKRLTNNDFDDGQSDWQAAPGS